MFVTPQRDRQSSFWNHTLLPDGYWKTFPAPVLKEVPVIWYYQYKLVSLRGFLKLYHSFCVILNFETSWGLLFYFLTFRFNSLMLRKSSSALVYGCNIDFHSSKYYIFSLRSLRGLENYPDKVAIYNIAVPEEILKPNEKCCCSML